MTVTVVNALTGKEETIALENQHLTDIWMIRRDERRVTGESQHTSKIGTMFLIVHTMNWPKCVHKEFQS